MRIQVIYTSVPELSQAGTVVYTPSKLGGPDEDSDDEMRDMRSRVLVSCSGVCILVRQPGSACFEGHDHHDGSARTGRPVLRSRGAASRGQGRESLQGSF